MFEFKLPDIGEGVTEGEVVKWLVKAGDQVKEDQPIVEIMTDKATVEIASPKSGTIEKFLASDGDMVQVGKGLVMIQEAGSARTTTSHTKPGLPPEDTQMVAPATASATTSMAPLSAAAPKNNSTILASPATRKMAREHGIDLSTLPGSGDLGRITREDVENAVQGTSNQVTMSSAVSAGAPSAAYLPTPKIDTPTLSIPKSNVGTSKTEERIAVRGIRKKIVENMRLSVDHAAHFTHMDELDATKLVEVRNALKDEAIKYGVKLNYLPFVVKATCMALKKHPRLNGSLDEMKNEIVIKHYYNIGIAVATKDDDLIVPVIQRADQKSILEIAAEIKSLADKAQNNKLTPADFQDGTFTITSLGPLAGTYATPIINYPEVGILGFFAIKEKPVVRNGQIVIRHMANVAVSLDHRVVDGAMGATFTKTLISYLENPELLILHSA